MATFLFIVFVITCACVLFWAMRKSKAETELASRPSEPEVTSTSELLTTPADNRLAHHEELWETRCKQAAKGFSRPRKFVPKFEQNSDPEYDGYSRRDRHHVTPAGHVKEDSHVEDIDELTMPSA